ncbi:hypothetical protein SCANM63S_06770 [Streptomyces canarius]
MSRKPLTSSLTVSRCRAEMIGPTSAAGSNPSPTFSFSVNATNLAVNSCATRLSTMIRLAATQA